MIRIHFSRRLFFNRICCLALAIYLFNFSIDPIDTAPSYVPENLSFNDIESMTEFLCEEVFGLTNAFEESDDADSDSEIVVNNILKVFFSNNYLDVTIVFMAPSNIHYLIKNTIGHDLFKSDITIPPPKAV